ncbi:MAG: hypothetical protein PHV63_03660 [Candidatus Daviesbacteria bacterium]|nr:hypothetical protein [Candidatus Daviesbacteria bacterium]
MKLLALHGSAIEASRRKLGELRKKFDSNNVVVFEEATDLQVIKSSLVTSPLFSDQQLIILENPPEDFACDSSLTSDHLSVILWFDHEVSEKKPVMEWVKKNKGQVFYFPESREISVFPFLDFLAAKDKKAFLEAEKLKKANFDVHYFITMVFYLLRNLVVTPKTAPDFVKKKLIRQRAAFSLEKIEELYRDILEIDFKIKSGLLEKAQAEFLLVNKFIGNLMI